MNSSMVAVPRVAARAGVRFNSTTVTALPAGKPIGAVRSGVFGFFAGAAAAGAGSYSFLTKEFKTQNDLLLEDLYALNASVHRVAKHLDTIEDKVEALEKRK